MSSPARNYKWATAERGNVLALRYGAHSRRTIEPLSDELAAALLEERPDLGAFRFAVSAWAVAETRAAMLRAELDERGIVDDDGTPRESLLKWLHTAERRAAEERKALGLDPTARARLERDVAAAALGRFDLEAALAEGRRIRLAAGPRALTTGETAEDAPA